MSYKRKFEHRDRHVPEKGDDVKVQGIHLLQVKGLKATGVGKGTRQLHSPEELSCQACRLRDIYSVINHRCATCYFSSKKLRQVAESDGLVDCDRETHLSTFPEETLGLSPLLPWVSDPAPSFPCPRLQEYHTISHTESQEPTLNKGPTCPASISVPREQN